MSAPALLLAALAVAGNATPSGPPVAIACTGTSKTAYGTGTHVENRTEGSLPRQVYVFDEQAKTVRHALEPRQEFEPVCSTEGGMRFVSIAPGLVKVDSDDGADPVWTCSFMVDRMTGKASYRLRGEWKNGRYHQLDWTMSCKKTDVPVFDLSKRKF